MQTTPDLDFMSRPSTRVDALPATLLDAVGQAVIATDHDGRITQWNRAAEALFGWIVEQQRAERMQRMLADASARLAASLDCHEALADVARLAIPELADWCGIELLDTDGLLRGAVSAHGDPAKARIARELVGIETDPHGRSLSARVLRTCRAWLDTDRHEAQVAGVADTARGREILRGLGIRSWIAVPLIARGSALGVLHLAITESDRRYGTAELHLAEELAHRIAFALENGRLYEAAQRAVQERERVLRIVSHDLRNPLVAVVAHTDLLRLAAERRDADPKERQWIEMIGCAASQMNHLIGDLLDFTRIETGRLALSCDACNPEALIAEAVALHRPLAASRSVGLEVDEPALLPPVWADRARVLQIFSNLIGNALRFTSPGGSVTVRAEASGAAVRFVVADTGPGIPDEDLPHLFEPFWRGSASDRESTGLGLAIARGLVEALDGRLQVESRHGLGSTFHFTLPRCVPGTAAAELREGPYEAQGTDR